MTEEKIFHRPLLLPGPAGRLEAMLWTSPGARPRLTSLVCHPHPLFGGTMHNKVVFRVARTLHQLGLPVLRFNFRGAGTSEGHHDAGEGERDDVRAALDFMRQEFPEASVLLAGFSFGAWVGMRVGCEDARVSALIGLGLPVKNLDLSYLAACTQPKLIVQGTQDQYGDIARVKELVESMPEPKQLVSVEGADHFFTGKLDEVARAVQAWTKLQFPSLAVTPPQL
ncbi:MAG: alpha/beta hydrolase [Acidipila sp.]|nr:alpha/beta hydrolase [Acidipila sp.]